MMEHLTILAQAAASSAESASDTPFEPIDFLWEQVTALSWLQAVLAISFGTVYLLYGWRIFKVLVVICFALVGLYAGMRLGDQFFDTKIWGGVVGFLILAAISVPLMRWAVCALGAVAGGILTGGIWYAFELPEKYILAGVIIGVIAGGMISFIVFKIAVMLFTSFGGGVLIVTGMLSLFYHYESIQQPSTDNIHDWLYGYNWLLPVLLLIPTAVGMIVQNKFIKGYADWRV